MPISFNEASIPGDLSYRNSEGITDSTQTDSFLPKLNTTPKLSVRSTEHHESTAPTVRAIREGNYYHAVNTSHLSKGVSITAVTSSLEKTTLKRKQQRIEDLFKQENVSSTIDTAAENATNSIEQTWFHSCYQSFSKVWTWLYPSKLDLNPKKANTLLPQLYEINGLSNHHGTCYLNTALQLLADIVKINLQQGDCSEGSQNEKMMKVISEKIPSLMSLVNRTPMRNSDLKRLYQEASRVVAEQQMYEFLSGQKITSAQLETGYATGGAHDLYLHTLLYALEVQPVQFFVTNPHEKNYYKSLGTDITTNLYYQKASHFNATFREEKDAEVYLTPTPSFTMFVRDDEKHHIKDILQPIHFASALHAKATSVSYEPTMISVLPKNFPHTYVFMKKNGGWFEVNDSRIFAIPKEWESSLEEFCSEHASCISYRKIEKTDVSTTNLTPPINVSLENVTEQLRANGLDFVDRLLYSILGCPESFFTANATRWFSQTN